MMGNCRVVGTFVLWQRHCEDAEIECPGLHVGSGVLYEDAGAETGSSLMLTTPYTQDGLWKRALFAALCPHCSLCVVGQSVFLH